jgi:hypothetical protein
MEEFTTREGDVDELDLMPAGTGCAGRNAERTDGTAVRTTIADAISDEARAALFAGGEVILLDVKLRALPAPAGQDEGRVLLHWKMATDFQDPPAWVAGQLKRIEAASDDFDNDFTTAAAETIRKNIQEDNGAGFWIWELTIHATRWWENFYCVESTAWINPVIRDTETQENIRNRFAAIRNEIDLAIRRLLGGGP